jgi:hypothetical protein
LNSWAGPILTDMVSLFLQSYFPKALLLFSMIQHISPYFNTNFTPYPFLFYQYRFQFFHLRFQLLQKRGEMEFLCAATYCTSFHWQIRMGIGGMIIGWEERNLPHCLRSLSLSSFFCSKFRNRWHRLVVCRLEKNSSWLLRCFPQFESTNRIINAHMYIKAHMSAQVKLLGK